MNEYDEVHGIHRKVSGSPGSVGGRFDNRDRPDAPDMDLANQHLEDALIESGGRLALTGDPARMGRQDVRQARSCHSGGRRRHDCHCRI